MEIPFLYLNSRDNKLIHLWFESIGRSDQPTEIRDVAGGTPTPYTAINTSHFTFIDDSLHNTCYSPVSTFVDIYKQKQYLHYLHAKTSKKTFFFAYTNSLFEPPAFYSMVQWTDHQAVKSLTSNCLQIIFFTSKTRRRLLLYRYTHYWLKNSINRASPKVLREEGKTFQSYQSLFVKLRSFPMKFIRLRKQVFAIFRRRPYAFFFFLFNFSQKRETVQISCVILTPVNAKKTSLKWRVGMLKAGELGTTQTTLEGPRKTYRT